MVSFHHPLARRIYEATQAVFGEAPLTTKVAQACHQFQIDIENIQSARGIQTLLVAIVGAKGQGKTWIARQLIHNPGVRETLRSGDLMMDATTRLVWVGPVPPDGLNGDYESYLSCPSSQMVDIGQPYVILDTPGITDSDQRAAHLAKESLSLAPVKLIAIARDQLRAAANLTLAHQIDGAICIPLITSVDPEEINRSELQYDLRSLRDQLALMAPHSTLLKEILVPDFEILGDEESSAKVLRSGLLDRLAEVGMNQALLSSAGETRMQSVTGRLKSEVTQLISQELPHLAEAVAQLNRETEQLPARVLASLLGSQTILETGIRMQLRARLASDTSLLWFPYRTVLTVLNWTHGAWDRIVLALTGSVPSLFGALVSWAKNVRQGREFANEVSDGIRQRSQAQVEERLRPLCDQFRRAVMKLRPREDRESVAGQPSVPMRLLGMEELQSRSQKIFEGAIERHASSAWKVQALALIGILIFWSLMAAPIVILYREYFGATLSVWTGKEAHLHDFPSPHPGLFLTSLLLSLLPLMIYCMVVLTITLSRKRMQRIARQVADEHERAISELQASQVIRIHFEDELLEQAEFLLRLKTH